MKPSQIISTSLLAATAWAFNAKSPCAFYVKYQGNLEPLSATVYNEGNANSSFLTHKVWSPSPVEFTMDGDFATTDKISTPGAAGFVDGMLFVGGKTPKSTFYLDNERKVTSPFQSCEIFDSNVRGIVFDQERTRIPTSNCVDVEVYILPYQTSEKGEDL